MPAKGLLLWSSTDWSCVFLSPLPASAPPPWKDCSLFLFLPGRAPTLTGALACPEALPHTCIASTPCATPPPLLTSPRCRLSPRPLGWPLKFPFSQPHALTYASCGPGAAGSDLPGPPLPVSKDGCLAVCTRRSVTWPHCLSRCLVQVLVLSLYFPTLCLCLCSGPAGMCWNPSLCNWALQPWETEKLGF